MISDDENGEQIYICSSNALVLYFIDKHRFGDPLPYNISSHSGSSLRIRQESSTSITRYT